MKSIKVLVTKASDWNFKETKTFASIEEMFNWMKKTYSTWVIWLELFPDESNDIELLIVDDWIE